MGDGQPQERDPQFCVPPPVGTKTTLWTNRIPSHPCACARVRDILPCDKSGPPEKFGAGGNFPARTPEAAPNGRARDGRTRVDDFADAGIIPQPGGS